MENSAANNSGHSQNKEVVVGSLTELKDFARVFLDSLIVNLTEAEVEKRGDALKNALVVGLSGDLGAGKTTFSKAIAELMGIQEVVTSPTFGIQKQYKTNISPFEEFVHIDAYRIEDIKEVGALRFVELFQKPNTLVFIEWPEKIQEILPKDIIMLSFESVDENTRKISY